MLKPDSLRLSGAPILIGRRGVSWAPDSPGGAAATLGNLGGTDPVMGGATGAAAASRRFASSSSLRKRSCSAATSALVPAGADATEPGEAVAAPGAKKKSPVKAEWSQGTCAPPVAATTSLRTSIMVAGRL